MTAFDRDVWPMEENSLEVVDGELCHAGMDQLIG